MESYRKTAAADDDNGSGENNQPNNNNNDTNNNNSSNNGSTTTSTTIAVAHERSSDDNKVVPGSKKKVYLVYARYAIVAVGLGTVFAAVVLLWYFMGWLYGLQGVLVASIIVLLVSGKWRWVYIMLITGPRDLK